MSFNSKFKFGDKVRIDGGVVTGTVIGFCFYPHDHQVQVAWWNNGDTVEKWLGAWRLEAAS